MNASLEITELANWNGKAAGGEQHPVEGSLAQVQALLREIRDLQKAHFERYQEITGKIMAADNDRQLEASRLHIAQLHHQEEARRAAFHRQLISWAVWGAVVVFCIGSIYVFQQLTAFDF